MKPGGEKRSVRVVTLMSPRGKSDLQEKADRAGLSVSEIVRRAVNAYDPEEVQQVEEIVAFLRAHRENAGQVSATN